MVLAVQSPLRVRALSLGCGQIEDDKSITYVPTPTKPAGMGVFHGLKSPQKPQKPKKRGFFKRILKSSSTLSTAASSESASSVDSFVSTSPTSSRNASCDVDTATEEELFGGEEHLLERHIELEGIHSMRRALSQTEKDELPDPRMLIRHFRAEKGDTTKALHSLRAALKWRKEYGIDRVRNCMEPDSGDKEYQDMMKLENKTGKVYVRGTTKDGRALIYLKAMRNNTPKAEADNMKHLAWNIEKAIAVCDHHSNNKLDKYCLMIDCDNYKLSKSPSMSASKFTLDLLQKYYPERMYRAYVLNAPMAFRMFWNLIKAFVDPVTKSKIVFVSPGSPGLEQLYEDMGPEKSKKLEACSFGTAPVREFSSAEYLQLPKGISFDE